jgi:transcriptional regulator with XRE-family HTH domain
VAAQRSQAHAALGRAVRDFRKGRGVSQEALADMIPMDRTYLGGIERGERNPAYANLLRLAAALGVTVSELTRRAEEIEAAAGESSDS